MGRRAWIRGAILLGVVGAVVLFQVTDASQYLERERFASLLRGLGIWGPVLYVASFALLEPFGVVGIAFVVPGSLVWDWPTLFLLSWLGAVGAGVVGFAFARTVGRDWVSRHLPERMHRFDARLATQGLRAVVLVRLLFFLAPPAHWLLGLSRVRFVPFLLGTAIGFLPGMALFTYVGKGMVDALQQQPPWVWGAVIVVALLGTWWLRRRTTAGDAAA